MDRCIRCLQNPVILNRGTRPRWCKECFSAYTKKRVIKSREANLKWFRDQKRRPCADCKLDFPPQVMDFDHVTGEKRHSPSNMMGKGAKRETIAREIAKCEVVCACCHRTRTAQRVGKWNYRPTELGSLFASLKDRPCVVCGIRFPQECLDFDHRDPSNKKFSIATYKNRSMKFLPALMEEIAKCDLICARCHRLKTSKEWQSYSIEADGDLANASSTTDKKWPD